MKLVTMLQDIVHAIFGKAATKPYPNPKPDAPQRLRGKLHWNPEACTGCKLCVMDCPAKAIDLFVLDKKAKQFVMRYDIGHCTFCGQCVENCRFNCLSMPNEDWSLITDDRTTLIVYYGDEANVNHVLAGDITSTPDETE